MQDRELRNKIGEIFVKHGLPTRQIVIEDILALFRGGFNTVKEEIVSEVSEYFQRTFYREDRVEVEEIEQIINNKNI